MIEITDEEFDKIITESLSELPKQYVDSMRNVAIVMADEPSTEQRIKLKLRCNETLFGLYEGIPLIHRGGGYNMVLPDKITIFKYPIMQGSLDLKSFKKQVKHTLWHEIAHHYGFGHDQIHKMEKTNFASNPYKQ